MIAATAAELIWMAEAPRVGASTCGRTYSQAHLQRTRNDRHEAMHCGNGIGTAGICSRHLDLLSTHGILLRINLSLSSQLNG